MRGARSASVRTEVKATWRPRRALRALAFDSKTRAAVGARRTRSRAAPRRGEGARGRREALVVPSPS